eukprot:2494285-Prymnesium_polylepis.1
MAVVMAAETASRWPYTPPLLDPNSPRSHLSSGAPGARSALLQPPPKRVPQKSLLDLKIDLLREAVRAFDETIDEVPAPAAAE